MARLLSWPHGLRWNRWKWLSGPEAVGASADTTIGDFTQTIATPFGARHIQLSFPPMRGRIARRARGLVTALHKGANAVRLPMCDWDGLPYGEAGVQATRRQLQEGKTWNNGKPWNNGQTWKITKPNAPVTVAAGLGATIVSLADEFWGHELGMGDWIGFFPLHFGQYEITQVISAGQYRIWPPLRGALAVGDYATLYPVMAMRLKADNLPDADRGPAFLEGLTISLFETFDYDVRQYFTD
jgi:hypothetical protein